MHYYFITILELISILYLITLLFLLFKNKFKNKFIYLFLGKDAFSLLNSNKYTFKTYTKIKIVTSIQCAVFILGLIIFIHSNFDSTIKGLLPIILFVTRIVGNNLIIKYLESKDAIL